jgi:Mg2+ and Co2+ transporter CorA
MAGIFGMNFRSPIFDADGMLLPAIGFIAAVSVLILLIARWRKWL